MRISLIAPWRTEPLGFHGKASMAPPLALGILARHTPPDFEVSIVDEKLAPIDWETRVDLVGISCTTPTAPRAYEVADRYRAQGTKVVLGGMHPSALPEEALQHADSVVVGEGETVWPQLLADLLAGRLARVYRPHGHPNLAGMPFPRRDLFRNKDYVFPHTAFTTRGCPYGCSFCAVTTFFGGTYRSRPVEEVTAELEAMGSPRIVFFLDDNVAANPPRAKRLFRALQPYGLSWIGQADLNLAKDEELMALAAASGCVALLIGIESLSPENLRSTGKRTNSVETYEAAIARLHTHGISVFGAFLVGLDDDTADVFEATLRFARRVRLEGAQFNIPAPYPGTPLYDTLAADDRILSHDWAQYSSNQVVYAPRRMSASRLQEGHDWIWREFYSIGSIWERIGRAHPHLLLMWALNLNFRNDALSRLLMESAFRVVERNYAGTTGI